MKKITFVAGAFAMMLSMGAVSCSGGDDAAGKEAAAPAVKASDADLASGLNIRYIDEDSLMSKYNLAKDIKEASIKSYGRLESAQNSRSAELQRFAQQVDEKLRTNGYLSEQSYQADVAKGQKMQQDAQNYLANLQRNLEMEMAQGQAQVMDSIHAFIERYNKKYKYDAILLKSAGIYFNPALDITDEVVEGLNKAYNKVEGK